MVKPKLAIPASSSVMRAALPSDFALQAATRVRVEPNRKKLVYTHFTGESSAAKSEMVLAMGS